MSTGLCYYELGLYEDAEQTYREAIKSNSKLAEIYYNLAVLYASEKKIDRGRRQLETCLKINRNFYRAREAIKKLEDSGQVDWYTWWFGYKEEKVKIIRSRKEITFKPFLGAALIGSIALLLILTVIIAFNNASSLAPSVVRP